MCTNHCRSEPLLYPYFFTVNFLCTIIKFIKSQEGFLVKGGVTHLGVALWVARTFLTDEVSPKFRCRNPACNFTVRLSHSFVGYPRSLNFLFENSTAQEHATQDPVQIGRQHKVLKPILAQRGRFFTLIWSDFVPETGLRC